MLLSVFATVAFAAPASNDTTDTNQASLGVSFTHSVEVATPEYYGLEPKLGFTYNANGPVGIAGPGWGVTGFSTIERQSTFLGLPNYSASDRLFLDGQELIACSKATGSPGCTAGGTHATKIESYTKITQTGNEFKVCKDGICSRYLPIICTTGGIYRWGLVGTTDLLGHSVTYAWTTNNTCAGTPAVGTPAQAYPQSVTYNGGRFVVTLYFENSVNSFPIATGRGDIVLSKRLRSVDIKVRGVRQGAYALTYLASSDVLNKIQPYGTDAVVDAITGAVTSGTLVAAAHTFVMPTPTVSFAAGTAAGSIVCPKTQTLSPVDLNGDGFTDFVCIDGKENSADSTNQILVYLNNKAGGFGAATNLGYPNAKKPPTLVDINCDRRPDLVWLSTTCPVQWKARLNNGAGVFSATETAWANIPVDVDLSMPTQFSDINADGCTDVLYPSTAGLPSTRSFKVMYGQQSTTDDPNSVCLSAEAALLNLPADTGTDNAGATLPLRFTDINNNGAADLVYMKNTTNVTSAEVRAILGSGYAINQSNVLLGLVSDYSNLAAMNFGQLVGGRGSDMVYVKADTLSIMLRPWSNTAQNFGTAVQIGTAPAGQPVLWLSTGDFNGDGKQDIVAMTASSTTTMKPYVYLNQSAEPRLSEVRNGLNGVRRITYVNAATQPSTLDVPAQMVVKTIADSTNGTTFFTTTYDYAKGLYDSVDKRFIGFWRVTRTQPCVGTVCPKATVYFDLDYIGAAPNRVDRIDVTGNKLLNSTLLRYATKTTLPYRKQLSERWEYHYSSSSTAARRITSSFTYDTFGRLATTTDYGEGTTGLRLNVNEFTAVDANFVSRLARTALYEGPTVLDTMKRSETKYTYLLPSGLLQKSEVWVSPLPAGATTPYVATTYTYDTLNRLYQTTAPMNRVTTLAYETLLDINVASVTNAKGQTERTSWNATCGKPATTTGLNGDVTTYTYDVLCREKSRTHQAGYFMNTSYFLPGGGLPQRVRVERPPAGTNGNANLWVETYLDGDQREIETRQLGPSTIIQRKTYDAHGNLASLSNPFYEADPLGVPGTPYFTTFKYDALGRKLETTFATGDKIVTAYSERNSCTTDEMGYRSCEEVNSLGYRSVRTELLSDGRWVATRFSTGVSGELKTITDPLGNVTTNTYDSLGRKVTEADPVTGTTRTVYNMAGEVERQTNQLGEVTVYTYDPLGRVGTKVTRNGTANAKTTTYTYDVDLAFPSTQLGHLTKVVDPFGTTLHSYTMRGDLFRKVRTILSEGDTPPATQTTYNDYDLEHRVVKVTSPDNSAAVIYYDPAGRANQLQMTPNAYASIPTWQNLAFATFEASGQASNLFFENGVFTEYRYQPQRGFLNSAVLKDNTSNPKISYVYTRNKKGLISKVSQNIGGTLLDTAYSYDTRAQMLSATSVPGTTQTWTYNDIGRIATSPLGTYCYAATSTAYPAPHAVRSVGDCTVQRYSYNTMGGLLSGPLVPNDVTKGTRSLTYDGEGRVEQVTLTLPGVTLPYIELYRYAFDGSRLRSRITSAGTVTGNTYYYSDGYDITRKSSGDTITQLYSLGDIPVVRRTRTGTTDTFSYLHLNHLGSVVAETNAAGVLSTPIQYAPYGKESNQTFGASSKQHRGFLAEQQEATGLTFLNARYYDPALGQFVTADPVRSMETSLGLHPYAYSLNDPINRTDPTGLLSQPNGPAGDSPSARGVDLKSMKDTYLKGLGRIFDRVGKVIEIIDRRFSYTIADPGSENGSIQIHLSDVFARGGVNFGREGAKRIFVAGRTDILDNSVREIQAIEKESVVLHWDSPGKFLPTSKSATQGHGIFEHGLLPPTGESLTAMSQGRWGAVYPTIVHNADEVVFDLRGMTHHPITKSSDWWRPTNFRTGTPSNHTDSELQFFYTTLGQQELGKVFFRNIPNNFPVPMVTPSKWRTTYGP